MSVDLRKVIPHEEFDYQVLLSALTGFSRPRDKITRLLRDGVIIRVKKGLYIFGDDYRRGIYSPEIVANLMYGPSYISLDYALQYYGLIPEGVSAITSVTVGRSRRFVTPIGLFTYRAISLPAYRAGMCRVDLANGRGFLIASPEKALADKICTNRGVALRSVSELRSYLESDLRMDLATIRAMDARLIDDFAQRYGSRKLHFLARLIGGKERASHA